MKNLFSRLKHLFPFGHSKRPRTVDEKHDLHVIVPDTVQLPLPRSPREEMSVPASINGRDLSSGRL